MIILKINYIKQILQRKFYSLNYLKFFVWQVSVKKNCRFYGWVKVFKTEQSTITIGNNCSFRSKSASNWIGVDRPCIVSTQGNENANLEIGDNCGFSGTVIGCFRKIKLGNNVRCGANTLITDSDWHLDDPRTGQPKEVIIGDNVWIGVNATVLKGVRIGENSIIGAGSIVVNNIPCNVIAAGNPCKVIKQL